MNLTPTQKQALKAHLLGNSDTAAAFTDGNLQLVADLMNAAATPDFKVWMTSITKSEIQSNGFSWVQIDNVSDLKWRVWVELFDNPERKINPSKPNVRAGIAEVWTGSAPKLAVQAYVLGKCKRSALRLERLFSTGTGSDATPGDLGFDADGAPIEGQVPYTLFMGL